MENIIGLYKRDVNYNDLRVGTPDPNAYHDISTVNLELNGTPLASRIGSNHGFSGLRGVIIPRASRDGGSRGHDHMIPKPAYIDPELTNRRIVIDPQQMQGHPEEVIEAIREAYSNYPDPADATIAAFAKFAMPMDAPPPDEITISQPQTVVPTPMATSTKSSQGYVPNTYVVPQSLPGGGQAKHASFGVPQQPGFGQSSLPQPTQPPSIPVQSRQAQQRSMQAVRSLRGEFDGTAEPSRQTQQVGYGGPRPMRRATFEVSGIGEFPCLYHDVVRQDGNLILIYDHSHPTQHVWFPPVMEDPTTKEPTAIAVMVDGNDREPPMLYLAYPTGVVFKYRNEEFCLLTIEKEKPMQQKRGE